MSDKPLNRKILLIKLGALGDILRSLPAMYAVRHHFPDAQIDLLTRKPFIGFCRTIPWFNHVHTATMHSPWQIAKWLDFVREMRAQNYDLVIDMQCKPRTFIYHLLFGLGTSWSGDSIFCQYKRPRRTKPVRQHPNELLRQQWKALSIPFDVPADLEWLNDVLPIDPLPERYVVLVPGCSAQHPQKRWPASHYGALANKLDAIGIASIVIGTTAEKEAVEELLTLAPKAINLMGRTSIQQLASLTRSALGVITNDTGPAHLAGMVGAPTLVLYSAIAEPERILPVGPRVTYIKKDELANISAQDVLDTIRGFMLPEEGE